MIYSHKGLFLGGFLGLLILQWSLVALNALPLLLVGAPFWLWAPVQLVTFILSGSLNMGWWFALLQLFTGQINLAAQELLLNPEEPPLGFFRSFLKGLQYALASAFNSLVGLYMGGSAIQYLRIALFTWLKESLPGWLLNQTLLGIGQFALACLNIYFGVGIFIGGWAVLFTYQIVIPVEQRGFWSGLYSGLSASLSSAIFNPVLVWIGLIIQGHFFNAVLNILAQAEGFARDVLDGAQNTHTASVHKSASESAEKLIHRYGEQINTPRKLNTVLNEVHTWSVESVNALEEKNSEQSRIVLAAKRALDVFKTTALGKHQDPTSKVTNEQLLALAWLGIHDQNVVKPVDLPDALKKMQRGLYEIQRGNNLNEHGIDNGNVIDHRICAGGTFNKLVELLVGVHPDANIKVIQLAQASQVLPGVVREEATRNIVNFNRKEVINDPTLEAIWPDIQPKIHQRMSKTFSGVPFQKQKFDDLIASGKNTSFPEFVLQFFQQRLHTEKWVSPAQLEALLKQGTLTPIWPQLKKDFFWAISPEDEKMSTEVMDAFSDMARNKSYLNRTEILSEIIVNYALMCYLKKHPDDLRKIKDAKTVEPIWNEILDNVQQVINEHNLRNICAFDSVVWSKTRLFYATKHLHEPSQWAAILSSPGIQSEVQKTERRNQAQQRVKEIVLEEAMSHVIKNNDIKVVKEKNVSSIAGDIKSLVLKKITAEFPDLNSIEDTEHLEDLIATATYTSWTSLLSSAVKKCLLNSPDVSRECFTQVLTDMSFAPLWAFAQSYICDEKRNSDVNQAFSELFSKILLKSEKEIFRQILVNHAAMIYLAENLEEKIQNSDSVEPIWEKIRPAITKFISEKHLENYFDLDLEDQQFASTPLFFVTRKTRPPSEQIKNSPSTKVGSVHQLYTSGGGGGHLSSSSSVTETLSSQRSSFGANI